MANVGSYWVRVPVQAHVHVEFKKVHCKLDQLRGHVMDVEITEKPVMERLNDHC